MDRAVEAVTAWVDAESDWAETLVVVTADHETGCVTGPGADPRWTALTPAQGVVAPHEWNSAGHTNQLVPLYARGAGAGELAARATMPDPVRGAYLDTTTSSADVQAPAGAPCRPGSCCCAVPSDRFITLH